MGRGIGGEKIYELTDSISQNYFFYGAVEGVGTGVRVGIGVAVGTGVGVIVVVTITVGVGIAVGATVGVAVGVMVGVGVGVSGQQGGAPIGMSPAPPKYTRVTPPGKDLRKL